MKKFKKSTLFILIGVVLLCFAFVLTVYNIVDGIMAGKRAEAALSELKNNISSEESLDDLTSDGRPLYEKYPEMNMPLVEIDGEYYIGILNIPSLNIELPVREEFSYDYLKTSPCKYEGSVYMNNMIIAAHNYSSHFGNLKNLSLGDNVTFIDGDGNLFSYNVAEIIQVDGTDIEGMKDGDWDMTLFTCSLDGRTRVTVRLVKTESGPPA